MALVNDAGCAATMWSSGHMHSRTSPQSVEITGIPHALASSTQFGEPSRFEVKHKNVLEL